jgi:hypothetical protein
VKPTKVRRDVDIYLRHLCRFGPHGSAMTEINDFYFCRNTPAVTQGRRSLRMNRCHGLQARKRLTCSPARLFNSGFVRIVPRLTEEFAGGRFFVFLHNERSYLVDGFPAAVDNCVPVHLMINHLGWPSQCHGSISISHSSKVTLSWGVNSFCVTFISGVKN